MEKNTKKADFKKRDRLVFLIIVVVIVVAVIACVAVLGGNNETKNNGQNGEQQGSTDNSSNNGSNANEHLEGQIDYTKNENVEIKDNVKENNSKALLKEKVFNGMKVKDIKLTASNGTTKFLATVENTTSADFKNRKLVIVFKNQDGSEYARLNAYIGDIRVGESAEIDATTTSDLSNAYDFVIEEDK